MAKCECCDDPEPGEFRLITALVIGVLVVGAVVLLRPWFSAALAWAGGWDLLVPADDAALRLNDDVGLSWVTLGVGFLVAVLAAWVVSRVMRALGLISR